MENNNQNNDQQKNDKKIAVAFEGNIKKLEAIVNGKEGLKPVKKVKRDAISELVENLFKEEREATEKEVKEGLKSLLKGYVTLQNTVKEEEVKLQKFKTAKMKEFNEAAGKLFNKVEGLDGLTAQYFGAMNAAVDATQEENTNSEETE